MGAASSLRSLGLRWRSLWGNLTPKCGCRGCTRAPTAWHQVRRKTPGVRLQGTHYCQTRCLELALLETLGRSQTAIQHTIPPAHRIPLGLLLHSRQQITAAQLRTALEAQREAVRTQSTQRKIGAWLRELGFATETQITAALARQWSCPVLRSAPMAIAASRFPAIPALLLESFQMMPVGFVEATGTLLMAFSESIDYTVLYAIEQMLGYHTEACLVCPSTIHKTLLDLTRHGNAKDVVFDRMEDSTECARTISNYSEKVKAEEVRLARCGEHLWIRLERMRAEAVTLVLRMPRHF